MAQPIGGSFILGGLGALPGLSSAVWGRQSLAARLVYERLEPSIVAEDAGLNFRLRPFAEQRQSPLPLLALLACADPRTVADNFGQQPRLPHLAQQRQNPAANARLCRTC